MNTDKHELTTAAKAAYNALDLDSWLSKSAPASPQYHLISNANGYYNNTSAFAATPSLRWLDTDCFSDN